MSVKPKKPTDDPCSHWYPGHRPYQAPEVNHIATYIEGLPNLKAFIDLRSYGQMCTFACLTACLLFLGLIYCFALESVLSVLILVYEDAERCRKPNGSLVRRSGRAQEAIWNVLRGPLVLLILLAWILTLNEPQTGSLCSTFYQYVLTEYCTPIHADQISSYQSTREHCRLDVQKSRHKVRLCCTPARYRHSKFSIDIKMIIDQSSRVGLVRFRPSPQLYPARRRRDGQYD